MTQEEKDYWAMQVAMVANLAVVRNELQEEIISMQQKLVKYSCEKPGHLIDIYA